MDERKMGTFAVEHSIMLGGREVVLGTDRRRNEPFMVCCCTYEGADQELKISEYFSTADYLEAMQEFINRVQAQITVMQMEHQEFQAGKEFFTTDHCIYDDEVRNITGKVVVMDVKGYEYEHSAYQLILVKGGIGAMDIGHRTLFGENGKYGQEMEGIRLIDRKKGIWNRCDVLGIIRSECMPQWAIDTLFKMRMEKRERNRGGR